MEGLKSDSLTQLICHSKGSCVKNAKLLPSLCFLLWDSSRSSSLVLRLGSCRLGSGAQSPLPKDDFPRSRTLFLAIPTGFHSLTPYHRRCADRPASQPQPCSSDELPLSAPQRPVARPVGRLPRARPGRRSGGLQPHRRPATWHEVRGYAGRTCQCCERHG